MPGLRSQGRSSWPRARRRIAFAGSALLPGGACGCGLIRRTSRSHRPQRNKLGSGSSKERTSPTDSLASQPARSTRVATRASAKAGVVRRDGRRKRAATAAGHTEGGHKRYVALRPALRGPLRSRPRLRQSRADFRPGSLGGSTAARSAAASARHPAPRVSRQHLVVDQKERDRAFGRCGVTALRAKESRRQPRPRDRSPC